MCVLSLSQPATHLHGDPAQDSTGLSVRSYYEGSGTTGSGKLNWTNQTIQCHLIKTYQFYVIINYRFKETVMVDIIVPAASVSIFAKTIRRV